MTERPEMRGVVPHLIVDGAAKAIDFYKTAFGAEEMIRLAMPDGKLMHASIAINGGIVMLVDENIGCGMAGPLALKGTPVTLHLMVPDVDAAFERAVEAGATARMPPADMFWGDRYCVVVDPFGHSWSIATHQRDLSPEEIAEAGRKAMAEMGAG